jgi:hypothetical protein
MSTITVTGAATTLTSAAYLRVASLPASQLEAIMLRGETPDLAAMEGWEYRGTNTPAWASLVGIKKFVKGFFRTDDGRTFGYNQPVVQDGLQRPWRALPDPQSPKRFGFYRVSAVEPTSIDNAYLHAVLLDYAQGGNFALDPSNGLRDYLVRVEPGSDEILLGKALFAVGPARVPVSYFVLERLRHTGWRKTR